MPSSGDCVNGLAQLPSRDGREVENQVAAPAVTRTPNLHRANKSLTEECGWKGGDSFGLGAKQELRKHQKKSERLPPFLPDGMVTDRSSPSRVRYAAPNAPLTAPGRSAHPPVRKKREISGKAKQRQSKIYLTWTGLLMEGYSAQPPCRRSVEAMLRSRAWDPPGTREERESEEKKGHLPGKLLASQSLTRVLCFCFILPPH
jgi:hypothetical protein